MKFQNFEIPNDIIDSYVDKLGCSIMEACEAWLCDNGHAVNQEQEEMSKKAQFAGVGKIIDADHKQHKKPQKKADDDKKMIISALFEAINAISDGAAVRNDEKYIDFVLNNAEYTINLVKHRKKE